MEIEAKGARFGRESEARAGGNRRRIRMPIMLPIAVTPGSVMIWLFFHTFGVGSVSTGERGENIARNPLKRDIRGF